MTRIRLVRMMMFALAACALSVLIAGCPEGPGTPKKRVTLREPRGRGYAPGVV